MDEKQIKELEKRLSEMRERFLEARDAAQAGLEMVSNLKHWLTECEIERLKKAKK
jgi:hypothetical protein